MEPTSNRFVLALTGGPFGGVSITVEEDGTRHLPVAVDVSGARYVPVGEPSRATTFQWVPPEDCEVDGS